MMKSIKDIVYVPDYMAVLCVFFDNRQLSVNELHYSSQISYSSLHDMKKTFVEKGWVEVQKIDKKHIVLITPKGEELVKVIYDLLDKLGIDKEEFLKLKLSRKHKGIKKVKHNGEETSNIGNEEGTENKIGSSTAQETISGGLSGSEEATITGESGDISSNT